MARATRIHQLSIDVLSLLGVRPAAAFSPRPHSGRVVSNQVRVWPARPVARVQRCAVTSADP